MLLFTPNWVILILPIVWFLPISFKVSDTESFSGFNLKDRRSLPTCSQVMYSTSSTLTVWTLRSSQFSCADLWPELAGLRLLKSQKLQWNHCQLSATSRHKNEAIQKIPQGCWFSNTKLRHRLGCFHLWWTQTSPCCWCRNIYVNKTPRHCRWLNNLTWKYARLDLIESHFSFQNHSWLFGCMM